MLKTILYLSILSLTISTTVDVTCANCGFTNCNTYNGGPFNSNSLPATCTFTSQKIEFICGGGCQYCTVKTTTDGSASSACMNSTSGMQTVALLNGYQAAFTGSTLLYNWCDCIGGSGTGLSIYAIVLIAIGGVIVVVFIIVLVVCLCRRSRERSYGEGEKDGRQNNGQAQGSQKYIVNNSNPENGTL